MDIGDIAVSIIIFVGLMGYIILYRYKEMSTLDIWMERLGIDGWDVKLERISPKQVVYPEDICKSEKFFIGIERDYVKKKATLYHDRYANEESIVHELLHLKYPEQTEEWVRWKTSELLK